MFDPETKGARRRSSSTTFPLASLSISLVLPIRLKGFFKLERGRRQRREEGRFRERMRMESRNGLVSGRKADGEERAGS